ncbi:MAG: acetylglutamate kinase [Microscillaceae bacterium]|nr:acetylglutamate kinase [Microscillaceae bacterium]MDW8460812.1 acetylglutamate kinase [Cytophagales bacterium]
MIKPKLTLLKVGGKVVEQERSLSTLLQNFKQISTFKLLVHGGGQLATEISKKLGIVPKMYEGRRITDADTLKVVTMVYAGLVNKNIVAKLQALQINALGLSGADLNLIQAYRRPAEPIDFGFVGNIDKVNVEILCSLIEQQICPVMCAITHDGQGNLLNTNADTIASALAIALSNFFEVTLVYCFEKIGVLLDVNDETTLITELTQATYQIYKNQGRIYGGMLPKLDNAFQALHQGVHKVIIGSENMQFNASPANWIGTHITLT